MNSQAPKRVSSSRASVSRGNQRTSKQQQQKASPQISEHQELHLFEKLLEEEFDIEDVLEQLKDAQESEYREDLLQNFCVLLFKLVGLNSFVGKLEGKSSGSIDAEFLKTEVESQIEGVIDFSWVFTAPKEEHAFLKNNLYNLLGSLFLESIYFKNPKRGQNSFFDEISRILVVLSKSRLMRVRQNCVRLTRIFVEQGAGRLEKLRNAALRGLDADEKVIMKNLEEILAVLSLQILSTRAADKYAEVSSDALTALEVYFMLSTNYDFACLESIASILDAPQSLSEDVLGLLAKIDWGRNEATSNALFKLFAIQGFRQRIIYFTNTTSLAVSLRAIQLIATYDQLRPTDPFSDQDLIKIMATILHPYEEVRREGLKIFIKFLNIHENDSCVLRIHLEGNSHDFESNQPSVQSVFPFKTQNSKLIDIQHRVYQVLNLIDGRLWEKEQLVENLVESLAFELGPLYDFSSIFKLLVKLPESDLGDVKYQFLRLMVLLLRKTMGVLSRIAAGKIIPNRFTKQQQEMLLVIQGEYFQNLLGNSSALMRIMREDRVFKEQISLLILAIPPVNLSENLKESTFQPFAKSLADIITSTLTDVSRSTNNEQQQMSLIATMFALLQYCVKHVPRAYREHFQLCKDQVISQCIIKATDHLHDSIVANNGQYSSDELHGAFIQTLMRVCACAEMLSEIPVVYSEDFVQKWLEITDAVFDSSSIACLFNFNSLSLQLNLYLNILKLGLAYSSGDPDKLKVYLRYRPKILRQTWLCMREDKRKTIEFNLDVLEAKRIVKKAFFTAIDAVNFVSNKRFSHLSLIYLQIPLDDPMFIAMSDYLSDLIVSDPTRVVAVQADAQMQPEIVDNKETESSKKNSEQVVQELIELVEGICSLTQHNPAYLSSSVGVLVLRSLSGHQNKKIVELIRRNYAASRMEGKRSSGFTPFWRAFDCVVESLLESGKDARSFIAFANRAYFLESYATADGDIVQAKREFKDLAERQIYYFTAKLKDLLENPNKISTLEALGYLLQIRVNYPKSLSADDAIFISQYKKKYHTLFLKKVQDFIIEFKANNVHLACFNDTILSERTKNIIYKYVNALEVWSGVKFDVDPYGDSVQHLNESKAEAEKSMRLDRTPTGKQLDHGEQEDDEEDGDENNVDGEDDDDQGDNTKDTLRPDDDTNNDKKKQNKKQQQVQNKNKIMEEEEEVRPIAVADKKAPISVSRKTKKAESVNADKSKQSSTSTQSKKQLVQPTKRAERRPGARSKTNNQ